MVRQEYLTEGTLTRFTGIPFGDQHPYTYLEAKRVLGLLMHELRRRRSFLRDLGIDPKLPGRGAIRGRQEARVWDFLRLRESRNARIFTDYPHLTIVIRLESALAIVPLPHGVKPGIRQRVLAGGG